MRDETKLDEMGTHQFTRGTRGNPRPRRNAKAPKRPGFTKVVNDERGMPVVKRTPEIPGAEHPRAGDLARRREAFDTRANKNLTHAGLHRPGAIHSRGGRA